MKYVSLLISCLLLCISCNRTPEPRPAQAAQPPASTSNYLFSYEDWLEPKVLQLRKQENLDAVVGDARAEMEIFERLTLWSRKQFEPGFPDPYPLSNGVDILKDIRAGKTKGFCAQYTYLLADALKSIGFYDVRYVEIGQDLQHTHFLLEVWSNRLSRWMLLDPLYAAIVEDAAGAPQSAWQVHSAIVEKKIENLHRRWLAPETEVPRGPDLEYFALYGRTAVSLRNDLARMDHPWTIQERQRDFLQMAANVSALPNEYQNISGRAEDFTSPRNVCGIQMQQESSGLLVRLDNAGTCAHFDYFEVRLDNGEWKRTPPEFIVSSPFKTISCWTTNKGGIHGPVTTLQKP